MLDDILLNFSKDGDDCDLAFTRHDGDPTSNVIVFLPWKTPLFLARQFRLVPERYLACYELPFAIVSSEPHLCARAMRDLIADAAFLIARTGLGKRARVVGLSMGSAPATAVAGAHGCEVYSVASADRGQMILWQSPACTEIRSRAERKGYKLSDFAEALDGLNPVDTMHAIAPSSRFVSGSRDQYVPLERRRALEAARAATVPYCPHRIIDKGHVLTMADAMRDFAHERRDPAERARPNRLARR